MKNIPEEIAQRLIYRKPTTQEEIILPVVEIKPVPNSKCDDCDHPATAQREFALVTTPFTHWREKCLTCKRYRHARGNTGWISDAHSINRLMNSADYRRANDPRLRDLPKEDK